MSSTFTEGLLHFILQKKERRAPEHNRDGPGVISVLTGSPAANQHTKCDKLRVVLSVRRGSVTLKKASSFLPHCFTMATPFLLSLGCKRCHVGKWVVNLEMFPDHLNAATGSRSRTTIPLGARATGLQTVSGTTRAHHGGDHQRRGPCPGLLLGVTPPASPPHLLRNAHGPAPPCPTPARLPPAAQRAVCTQKSFSLLGHTVIHPFKPTSAVSYSLMPVGAPT